MSYITPELINKGDVVATTTGNSGFVTDEIKTQTNNPGYKETNSHALMSQETLSDSIVDADKVP